MFKPQHKKMQSPVDCSTGLSECQTCSNLIRLGNDAGDTVWKDCR